MPAEKILKDWLAGEPVGSRTDSIRWLQKRLARAVAKLPYDFETLESWEGFREKIRNELPQLIGIPEIGPMGDCPARARFQVGDEAICERLDIHMDDDYYLPAFVFSPLKKPVKPMPALLWNPGWPQTKWDPQCQAMAMRIVRHGFVVMFIDHAPFGETGSFTYEKRDDMTNLMGMGHLLGISQLALRSAETMRAGEYLRARTDVSPDRVALAGLCQGGQDTWLTAAIDTRFCAAAPFCSASTFAIHMSEMASYFANADSSPFPLNILKLCDSDHLHACIAPRPLMVRANLPDQWWPVSGLDCIESFSQKIYRLYGCEDRLDVRAEVHEHNITGPFLDALEQFLLRYVAE